MESECIHVRIRQKGQSEYIRIRICQKNLTRIYLNSYSGLKIVFVTHCCVVKHDLMNFSMSQTKSGHTFFIISLFSSKPVLKQPGLHHCVWSSNCSSQDIWTFTKTTHDKATFRLNNIPSWHHYWLFLKES